jgi:hypothetical protein
MALKHAFRLTLFGLVLALLSAPAPSATNLTLSTFTEIPWGRGPDRLSVVLVARPWLNGSDAINRFTPSTPLSSVENIEVPPRQERFVALGSDYYAGVTRTDNEVRVSLLKSDNYETLDTRALPLPLDADEPLYIQVLGAALVIRNYRFIARGDRWQVDHFTEADTRGAEVARAGAYFVLLRYPREPAGHRFALVHRSTLNRIVFLAPPLVDDSEIVLYEWQDDAFLAIRPGDERGLAIYWRLDQPRPFRLIPSWGDMAELWASKKGRDLFVTDGRTVMAFAGNPPSWRVVLSDRGSVPAFQKSFYGDGRMFIYPPSFEVTWVDIIAEVLYPSEVKPPYWPFIPDKLMMYYPWDLLPISPASGEVLHEDPKEIVLRWDVGGLLKAAHFRVQLDGKVLEKATYDEKTGLLRAPLTSPLNQGRHFVHAFISATEGKSSELTLEFIRGEPPKKMIASCDRRNCEFVWVELDALVKTPVALDTSRWKVVSAQGETIPVILIETRSEHLASQLPRPGILAFDGQREPSTSAVMLTLGKRIVGAGASKHRVSFRVTETRTLSAFITFPL